MCTYMYLHMSRKKYKAIKFSMTARKRERERGGGGESQVTSIRDPLYQPRKTLLVTVKLVAIIKSPLVREGLNAL